MGIFTKRFGLGGSCRGYKTVQDATVEPVMSMCSVQTDGRDNSAAAGLNHCSAPFLRNTAAAAATATPTSLLPGRRLWTLGSAQRAIVSRPAGPPPNSEAARRKKGGPKIYEKKVVFLQRPDLSLPPLPHFLPLAAVFLFFSLPASYFFYVWDHLLMRQRQGATVSSGWAKRTTARLLGCGG